jgi:hypothetical protein
MSMMIIRHKVSDYGKWRPAFDSHSAMQKANGLSNPRVLLAQGGWLDAPLRALTDRRACIA